MSQHHNVSGKDRRRRKRALVRRDGYRCRKCGTTHGELTIDHVIPRSKGGSNRLENLQLLCATCNEWKADEVLGWVFA